MTTYSNGDRNIQVSLSYTLHEEKETIGRLYIPELPTIICNNRSDAENIQQQVNNFINDLAKNILKEKE